MMQQAKSDAPQMTLSNGVPVDNNQNTLTAGPLGPVLIMDNNYIDKIAHFDRERVPERVVHAKGAGAHGYFEVTKDVTKYCKAKFLEKVGKRTPIFCRWSPVRAERGGPDTRRDPRGFSCKFYTEEGNWDMVANSTPVFFISDPIKFPDLIHAFKRNPQTNLIDMNMFWDFLSQTPESLHATTMVFSDRGIPDGFRHHHAYGNHTFKWVNDKGEVTYVKWHFISNQGIKNLTDDQAVKLEGDAPEYACKDLFDAIESGNYPSWTFYIQAMPEAEAANYRWNILDVTKVWLHSDYPLIEVGKLVFDRNPENYFADVEQAAFSPANMVPGIEPTADKLLQGRMFSYGDTQRHRIGPNYQFLPINCPYNSKVVNDQRDGPMVFWGNQGSRLNYQPCSWGSYQDDKKYSMTSFEVSGLAGKYSYAEKVDHFTQPRLLFEKVLSPTDREHLYKNIANKLRIASTIIQERQCKLFFKVHPDYGKGVATELGLPIERLMEEAKDM